MSIRRSRYSPTRRLHFGTCRAKRLPAARPQGSGIRQRSIVFASRCRGRRRSGLLRALLAVRLLSMNMMNRTGLDIDTLASGRLMGSVAEYSSWEYVAQWRCRSLGIWSATVEFYLSSPLSVAIWQCIPGRLWRRNRLNSPGNSIEPHIFRCHHATQYLNLAIAYRWNVFQSRPSTRPNPRKKNKAFRLSLSRAWRAFL